MGRSQSGTSWRPWKTTLGADEGQRPVHSRSRPSLTNVRIPSGLKAAGVDRAELDRLSKLAFQDSCHQNNPRPVQEQDFRRIYSESLA